MTVCDEKAHIAARFYWENNGIFLRDSEVPDSLVKRMAFVYGVARVTLQASTKDTPPTEMAARAFINLGGGDPNALHGVSKVPLWQWAVSGVVRALEAGWPELRDDAAWKSTTGVDYFVEYDEDRDIHAVAAHGPRPTDVRVIGPFTEREAHRFVAAMRE